MKRFGAVLTGLVLACVVLSSAASGSFAADRVHTGSFWSWTGPSDWDAVYSKQGITVISPSDNQFIDWGFGPTLCTPGNSVRQSATRFMNAQRRFLIQNGANFTSVGRVGNLGGDYFRQTSRYRARAGGKSVSGQFVVDYNSYDATYCYQSRRLMVAPARGFAANLRKLNRIYHSMAYRGPGTIEPPR